MSDETKDAGWQPIETAPTDGSPIIGYIDWLHVFVVRYAQGYRGKWRWVDTDGTIREPSHWCAVPHPSPQVAARKAGA